MNVRRWVIAGLGVLVLAGSLAACGGPSGMSGGNASEAQTSHQDLNTFQQGQPAPHFLHSVYRDEIIKAEAAQALGEQTTSFGFNMGIRDPMWSCPSVGFPVPNTAQLTNPNQVITWWGSGSTTPDDVAVIGNIDPNGGYAPTNSTGTFVECVNSAGQDYFKYWEGFVDTEGTAAHWDYTTHTMVTAGAPTMPVCTVQKVTIKNKTQNENVCHLPK